MLFSLKSILLFFCMILYARQICLRQILKITHIFGPSRTVHIHVWTSSNCASTRTYVHVLFGAKLIIKISSSACATDKVCFFNPAGSGGGCLWGFSGVAPGRVVKVTAVPRGSTQILIWRPLPRPCPPRRRRRCRWPCTYERAPYGPEGVAEIPIPTEKETLATKNKFKPTNKFFSPLGLIRRNGNMPLYKCKHTIGIDFFNN